MIARHNRLLLDSYLSGQVSAAQWDEHLKDPVFAKFVASEMGVAKPEPTLGARERALDAYLVEHPLPGWAINHNGVLGVVHDLFKAGWNARKQLDYETALGIKR